MIVIEYGLIVLFIVVVIIVGVIIVGIKLDMLFGIMIVFKF